MEYSEQMKRVLKLAGGEAVASSISEIMPAHLIIALSRMSESDAATADATVLRHEFDAFGIEPRKFRRHLRGVLAVRSEGKQPDSVRVSESTQRVLALSAVLAQGADDTPFLAHMVRAVLLWLADIHTNEPKSARGHQDNAADEIPHEL